MTPQFQRIYEGVLKTISESRTKGSKTSGKTLLVMFDPKSRVKSAADMKPMLEEMRKAYFDYLKANFKEEHGEDFKKFEPMFKAEAQKAAWAEMVQIGREYKDKDEELGEVLVVEVKLNAGAVNKVMNTLIKDRYFTYHWSTAAVYDLFVGSTYQGVLDPRDNPLVQKNEELKAKYKFTADELSKDDVYTGQQARKQSKQKFLRQ